MRLTSETQKIADQKKEKIDPISESPNELLIEERKSGVENG